MGELKNDLRIRITKELLRKSLLDLMVKKSRGDIGNRIVQSGGN
jgi:hypothetical protein